MTTRLACIELLRALTGEWAHNLSAGLQAGHALCRLPLELARGLGGLGEPGCAPFSAHKLTDKTQQLTLRRSNSCAAQPQRSLRWSKRARGGGPARSLLSPPLAGLPLATTIGIIDEQKWRRTPRSNLDLPRDVSQDPISRYSHETRFHA